MSHATPPAPCLGDGTRLVLIPSYNTGRDLLRRTVAGALAQWQPVWVVIDGSTDGSDEDLETLAEGLTEPPPPLPPHAAANPQHPTNLPHPAANPPHATALPHPALKVIRLETNCGKGEAVLRGMQAAAAAGFTHVLCLDADGQHPAVEIVPMMTLSATHPEATIMGQPIFGDDAPLERLLGRRIANFFTDWESGHCGLGDTLFGMRVYPLAPSLAVLADTRFARRFDFDPEIAVRLCWQGVEPIPHPVACRYLSKEEGGVSHFNYLRDNIYQILLHFRLLPRYLLRKHRVMHAHKAHWVARRKANAIIAHSAP